MALTQRKGRKSSGVITHVICVAMTITQRRGQKYAVVDEAESNPSSY